MPDGTALSFARWLSSDEIRSMLRRGEVIFAVVNVGHQIRWVAGLERFSLWKSEIRPRLLDPDLEHFSLDDFPDDYCYAASLWCRDDGGAAAVVCFMYH